MKKVLLFLILFLINIPSSYAYTKDDIFNLVNTQSVCDGNTFILFKSYNTTYTRLLTEKELSEAEINLIYNNLNTALNILNSKKVCRLRDLSLLTSEEKSKVLNALISGSNIITKASSSSGVVIDKNDKKVEIYDDGVLVDKVTLDTIKLTYTGPSIWISVSLGLIIILSVSYYILRKKNYIFILDMIESSLVVLVIIVVSLVLFRDNINDITNIKNLFMKINISNIKEEIVVDSNNKIVKYPKYGNVYGNISIPNLGISSEISFGDDKELLKDYIGHYTGTKLPGEGGVIVYSGHNSSKFLGNIKDVKESDIIIVNTSYGEFKYKVINTKIIDEKSVDQVLIDSDVETLVLYTCYPFSNVLYGSKRMVVYASLFDSKWGDTIE
jgi:sortase A